MSPVSPALALLAGALTVFSPCVLPLLPILFSSAASRGRWAPAALALGLASSFTLVGMLVASVGVQAAFDPSGVKVAGGVALALVGVVMVTPVLSRQLAVAGGPVVDWGQARLARYDGSGVGGQAVLGALLGLVWSPCVGPTLGAATLLAAQGRDLGQVTLVMAAFGLGAAGALAFIGYVGRRSLGLWNKRLRLGGGIGRQILGGSLIVLGVMMAVGLDHVVEAALVQITPGWLTRLTSHF